jgi:hypothetical protein
LRQRLDASTERRQSKLACEPPGGMRRSRSRRPFRDLTSGFCQVGFDLNILAKTRHNKHRIGKMEIYLRHAVALLAASAWLNTATLRYTATTQILLDPRT